MRVIRKKEVKKHKQMRANFYFSIHLNMMDEGKVLTRAWENIRTTKGSFLESFSVLLHDLTSILKKDAVIFLTEHRLQPVFRKILVMFLQSLKVRELASFKSILCQPTYMSARRYL